MSGRSYTGSRRDWWTSWMSTLIRTSFASPPSSPEYVVCQTVRYAGPTGFERAFYFFFAEKSSCVLIGLIMFVFSLSLWSLIFLWLYPFCFSFPCRCLHTGTCSFGGGGDVNLSRSNAPRSIDLWPLEPSVVTQAPLRTTPCCALCARAVLDSVHWFFSPRFFLLWFPFFWLAHVLFLGRWLTMFVSPRSRNDALSSVFILVPPFTRRGRFWFLLFFCPVVLYWILKIVPKPSTRVSSGW